MSAVNVYLKPNVLVEPLFNRWYAWTYLIAPATAAMFTANSHLKIMQSFIQAPQIHVAALKNPAMRGGPFIDASPDPRVNRAIAYREERWPCTRSIDASSALQAHAERRRGVEQARCCTQGAEIAT